MSGEYNRQFGNTRNFIRQNFLTAVRYPGAVPGLNAFDFNFQKVSGYRVVTLDAPGAHSRDAPLMGFWVPQGGSCIIDANPGATCYVFTPDFSGCSLIVDQLDKDKYRVYHVQGGGNYFQQEYINQPNPHGLGIAGSMTFYDYGDDVIRPRGFAFMKFEEGRWWIYFQRQNGVGINYGNRTFHTNGPQTVCGGGRVPVANLLNEVPRTNAAHSKNTTLNELPVTRNIKAQRRLLPNDELW